MSRQVIPENRALSLRPNFLYLPRPYAALLITVSGIVGVAWKYPVVGAWMFILGFLLGKTLTLRDPFAMTHLMRNFTLPRRLKP